MCSTWMNPELGLKQLLLRWKLFSWVENSTFQLLKNQYLLPRAALNYCCVLQMAEQYSYLRCGTKIVFRCMKSYMNNATRSWTKVVICAICFIYIWSVAIDDLWLLYHAFEVVVARTVIGCNLSPFVHFILFVYHCEVCDHILLRSRILRYCILVGRMIFLIAFIGYNPCFTKKVYHGIFTEVVQFEQVFTNLTFRFCSWLHLDCSWSVWIILLRKLVMPTVFMWYLRTRGGGRVWSTAGPSFENKLHCIIRWRAVCIAFSGQLQFGERILFTLWKYERRLPWFVRNCVRRKLGQRERVGLCKMVGMNS
jgi:hypothetical protein